ncbi:unnamed protein product [marine sediment metagenome]|uniref:Uncharacterized protein n=1 Tax=marine sediment metagenome TaxID=412755 RepID=X0VRN6_9ZZZZ
MFEVCKMSVERGYTHFFYGGDFGVADELKERMSSKLPGIKIVGTYTPPFRPLNCEEERDLIDKVSRLKPDIFWVGISTPKQERFMYEYLHKLNTKVMIGVGAAFDFHCNRVPTAPKFMIKYGFEWCYRLYQNPRRLWKRYLFNNPRFIFKIIRQLINDKF